MRVIDQYRDHLYSQLVLAKDTHPAAVEMLKQADFEVKEGEFESLPDDAFAWPAERAFPIHTKAATIASRLYRSKCAAVPVEVDKALAAACDIFQVPETVFERPKVASAPPNPDDYLLPSMLRLRVKCAEDVKVAEQKLLDGYQKLSIEHRAEACSRLIEKAAQHHVTLDPLMHRLAGYTVSSTRALIDWVEARKEAAAQPMHKNAFAKLASALREQPEELWDRPALVKIADAIDDLDRRAGLQKHYDRKLLDPMQTVFNTDKVASAGVELGGRIVPFARLASFDAKFYGDLLGDEFVREASDGRGGVDPQKMATIIETLPRDMKGMLARQMGPYLRTA